MGNSEFPQSLLAGPHSPSAGRQNSDSPIAASLAGRVCLSVAPGEGAEMAVSQRGHGVIWR